MRRSSADSQLSIADVRFKAAPPEQAATGLLGWLSCSVNSTLRLDGLTLRRTADGRHSISFPMRVDGSLRRRFYVEPFDRRAYREFQAQVFRILGIEEEGQP